MKHRIAIIGAGFSGLSVATFLDKTKFDITLFESSPKIGGRAFSYQDPIQNIHIDNGQHMMMGCYTYTLKLFNALKCLDDLYIQNRMHISYQTRYGSYTFKAMRMLPAPLHLLYSMLADIKPLSLKERFGLLIPSLSLLLPLKKRLKDVSVLDWLKQCKQSDKAIRFIWEPIAVGTMNDTLDQLSAYTFKHILHILFIQNAKNPSVILSKYGLTELLERAIKPLSGDITFRFERIQSIEEEPENYALKTSNAYYHFDYIVSTVPYFQWNKLYPKKQFHLKTTSIFSIHFICTKDLFDAPFIGLPESWLQWIFKRDAFTEEQSHIYSCVISAAEHYLPTERSKIKNLFLKEIKHLFSVTSEEIPFIKMIHEKRATFSDSVQQKPERPQPGFVDKNLLIAGDWTDTQLPATIESACKSGFLVAQQLNKLSRY